MVGLAGGRKTGRGTREGQESGWSGADGREGGFGVLFFLGREGAGGRSFLRRRKPGFGTEGGESQWHGKEANTKEKLETRLEIRVPSSPLGGFSRFKLERGKIPG